MANKVRSKGTVLAEVGHYKIRQIKDTRKEAKSPRSMTIAIMNGRKVVETGFKNTESAKEAATKLL